MDVAFLLLLLFVAFRLVGAWRRRASVPPEPGGETPRLRDWDGDTALDTRLDAPPTPAPVEAPVEPDPRHRTVVRAEMRAAHAVPTARTPTPAQSGPSVRRLPVGDARPPTAPKPPAPVAPSPAPEAPSPAVPAGVPAGASGPPVAKAPAAEPAAEPLRPAGRPAKQPVREAPPEPPARSARAKG